MSQIKLDVDNINKLILHWRKTRADAEENNDLELILIARCYVDAYQTVRINHGLPLLPQET